MVCPAFKEMRALHNVMLGSLWWFDETYGNFVRKMFPSALKKKHRITKETNSIEIQFSK